MTRDLHQTTGLRETLWPASYASVLTGSRLGRQRCNFRLNLLAAPVSWSVFASIVLAWKHPLCCFLTKQWYTNFVAAVLRKLSTSPSVPLFCTLFGSPSVVTHVYQVTFICLVIFWDITDGTHFQELAIQHTVLTCRGDYLYCRPQLQQNPLCSGIPAVGWHVADSPGLTEHFHDIGIDTHFLECLKTGAHEMDEAQQIEIFQLIIDSGCSFLK